MRAKFDISQVIDEDLRSRRKMLFDEEWLSKFYIYLTPARGKKSGLMSKKDFFFIYFYSRDCFISTVEELTLTDFI